MKLAEILDFDEKDVPFYWETPDKLRTNDLPPLTRYYHGTTLKNAKKILKTGLDPRTTLDRGEYTKGFIFLSPSINGAEIFAPGGIYGYKDRVGAILEINPPHHLATKIRTDLGEFPRCPVHIPPQFIRFVKYTNTKNIEEGVHKHYSLEDFLKAPVNRLHIRYKNLEAYYRKGPKIVDGVKYDKVLTRANTNIQGVRGFGQGNYRELDALTANLAREYGYDGVYIENVMNDWLAKKLPQYGYVEVDKHLRDQGNPPCFFKKLK